MNMRCKKILNRAAALTAMLLLSSCNSMSDKEIKKKIEDEKDRFAFLHRQKKAEMVDIRESSAQEQVKPERKFDPVISPEKMKKLGATEKNRMSVEELSKPNRKFYEEFIALNGDEELEVSLVFNSAPLLDVLAAFGDLLGFNFSADSDLKGVVTLNLNSKMTRRELWSAFENMLFLAGAGVKVDGSLLRIMQMSKVAMQPDQRPGIGSGEIYYKQLSNASASEIVKQIKPFLGSGAVCVELTRPNAVMICDSAENMPKLRQLLEYLDASGKANWPRMVVPCNNVLPNKIATELQELLPVLGLNVYKTTDRSTAPGAVQLVGIDRMRLIVISAATQEAIDLVKEWVTLLDTAGADDQENVFVYRVRNNKSAHLARALAVVFEIQGTSLTIDSTTGKTKLETITSPVTRNTQNNSNRNATRSNLVNTGTNIQTDQDSKVYGNTVRVFADGVLNRLVIRCTPRTYASIKALLDKLDVVPAQVLLQVLMVEVTLTESTQFGMEFSGSAYGNNTTSLFGTNYYTGKTDAGSTSMSPFIVNDDGTITYRDRQNRELGATFVISDPKNPEKRFGYIRAKAGNGEVKVISSPQLLVTSHTEAKIQVGENVPIITGGITDTISTTKLTNTYEYKETGITLTVTPYVTSTNLIALDIKQEMSQATTNDITPSVDTPLIDIRSIATSMTIANGQTMVLGGLIQEKKNDNLDSIPVINKLPFLKRLMGSTNASVARTEVLMLITGYIVNEHSELEELIKRYNDALKDLNKFDRHSGDHPDAKKERQVLFEDKDFWI